jgi:hypothetical protein
MNTRKELGRISVDLDLDENPFLVCEGSERWIGITYEQLNDLTGMNPSQIRRYVEMNIRPRLDEIGREYDLSPERRGILATTMEWGRELVFCARCPSDDVMPRECFDPDADSLPLGWEETPEGWVCRYHKVLQQKAS